jgi:Prokaryotic homologs of the JAB domain
MTNAPQSAQDELLAQLAAQMVGHFWGPQAPEAYDKPQNYVTASNGIFRVEKTPIALFVTKVSEIDEKKTKIPGLGAMQEGPQLLVPKIPYKYLIMALSWYRDVHTQDKTEASVLFFWNTHNKTLPTHWEPTEAQKKQGVTQGNPINGLIQDGQLVIYCPVQKNSGTLSEFHADNMVKYLREELDLLCETHSHHTMDAYFSGTDDANENATQFYGVWGKITQEQPKFAFRWVSGDSKVQCDPSILFDLPQVEIKTTVEMNVPGQEPIVTENVEYKPFTGPWARVEPPEDWMGQHSPKYSYPSTSYGRSSYANQYDKQYGTASRGYYGSGGYGSGTAAHRSYQQAGNVTHGSEDDLKKNQVESQGRSLDVSSETKTSVEVFISSELDPDKHSIVEVEERIGYLISALIDEGYDYMIANTITEQGGYQNDLTFDPRTGAWDFHDDETHLY